MAFFSYVLKNWDTAFLIAIIVFGVASGLEVIDDDSLNLIATATNTTVPEQIGHFGVWALSFNSLSPTFRYNLPFTDKYIIPINDIPFIDATDLPFIILIYLIVSFFMKKVILHQNKIVNKIYHILIILLFIVIGFLVWKAIMYQIYLWSSLKIGLTIENALNTREQFLSNISELSTAMLILSIFGGVAIYKKVHSKLP